MTHINIVQSLNTQERTNYSQVQMKWCQPLNWLGDINTQAEGRGGGAVRSLGFTAGWVFPTMAAQQKQLVHSSSCLRQ